MRVSTWPHVPASCQDKCHVHQTASVISQATDSKYLA
jgi:hypothetical protein